MAFEAVAGSPDPGLGAARGVTWQSNVAVDREYSPHEILEWPREENLDAEKCWDEMVHGGGGGAEVAPRVRRVAQWHSSSASPDRARSLGHANS